ncbi:MAG: alpha/beta hydrolase [Spirochaetota bacterium]
MKTYDPQFFIEDVYITVNPTVTIHGWYIHSESAQFTLLYFHGNAGNISNRIEKIKLFHSIPLSIFIIDYRGYGKSTGTPSEQGLYTDALSAFEYLTRVKNIPSQNIILYGESLGGAVAAYCATQTKPAALILDSTFTNISSMVKHHSVWILSLLFTENFSTIDSIASLHLPILILHSKQDEVAPFYMGKELYTKCPSNKKKFVELKGGHNTNFITDAFTYKTSIQEFVQSISESEVH